MKQEADDLFAEHGKPTHCCRHDVHSQSEPIEDMIHAARQQVLQYRRLLNRLERAGGNPKVIPVVEHLQQAMRAVDADVVVLEEHSRRLNQHFVTLDRYMVDAKAAIDKHLGASPPSVP